VIAVDHPIWFAGSLEDALLESWAGAVPEALNQLTGRERNKVYRMLRLEVTPTTDSFDVTGALGTVLQSWTDATAAARMPGAQRAASSTLRESPRR
jgi:hypothetical protein